MPIIHLFDVIHRNHVKWYSTCHMTTGCVGVFILDFQLAIHTDTMLFYLWKFWLIGIGIGLGCRFCYQNLSLLSTTATENSIFFWKTNYICCYILGLWCVLHEQSAAWLLQYFNSLYDDDDDVDDDEVDLFKKHFHLIFSKTFTLFSLDYWLFLI